MYSKSVSALVILLFSMVTIMFVATLVTEYRVKINQSDARPNRVQPDFGFSDSNSGWRNAWSVAQRMSFGNRSFSNPLNNKNYNQLRENMVPSMGVGGGMSSWR